MLHVLDYFLFFLHVAIIAFNLFGWIIPKWRKAHLILVSLTLSSWLLLGIWFGWGYCFLTDWHWDIKRSLGEQSLPNSFITYLFNNVFNWGVSPSKVDMITLITFIPAVLLSFYFNFSKRNTGQATRTEKP